mmetsp:Transcript_57884/g.179888  ORF Transcript_57884/g.179888 Transcript_57884/m.179888 type:complete len:511 (+) Transcript_57884:1-1533(+)
MRASETSSSEDATCSTGEPNMRSSDASPRRTAGALDLCAMGIGAVVSGDFFGWQATLAAGFGSGFVAVCIASVLYLILATSVAEVASIEGTGAGPCQFAEACFGRHVAFFTGLSEALKCVTAVAVGTTGIASYILEILQFDSSLAPAVWLFFLSFFTVLNIIGGDASRRSQLVTTSGSVLLLVVFYAGALARGVDVKQHALRGEQFSATTSFRGVLSAWPFALWFFLGIEELPLAMEVTVDPQRNMPRGLNWSFAVLVLLAFATLVISSSIPPGAEDMAKTTYPLLEGYRYAFGVADKAHWWWLVLVTGLIASLHSFIFATGQLLSQMAQDGHFPQCLRHRGGPAGAPLAGLVAGSSGALAIILALYLVTGGDVDGLGCVAIAMCLLSTLFSYMVQLACFLHLRQRRPEASRPFRSPFGRTGAAAGLALCIASLAAVLLLPALRGPLYLGGLALAAGILVVCTAVREASWRHERWRGEASSGRARPGQSCSEDESIPESIVAGYVKLVGG